MTCSYSLGDNIKGFCRYLEYKIDEITSSLPIVRAICPLDYDEDAPTRLVDFIETEYQRRLQKKELREREKQELAKERERRIYYRRP